MSISRAFCCEGLGGVDFDVSSTVKGDGAYGFALTSDSQQHIQFRSNKHNNAPELIITLQTSAAPVATADPAATPATSEAGDTTTGNDATPTEQADPAAPVATDDPAAVTATPEAGDTTTGNDATPTDQVDPDTAAADAAETTSDAELDPNAPSTPELQSPAPSDAKSPTLAAPQTLVTATTTNPMGCQAGEIFTDMQDWWSNPNASKDHGHLHVGVCFPHGQTLTGKITFRVRSVMHMNPGSLVRLAIYTTSPTVSGASTCGGNNGLACATGLPRTLARCTPTGGTVSDNGATCTWWDTLVVNTASVAYDGWQEFRFTGYIKEPDGTEMIVSNGLHAFLKNGHTVKNAVSSWDTMTDAARLRN